MTFVKIVTRLAVQRWAKNRDVRNRFLNFSLVSLQWFGSQWVWFGSVQKTRFSLDIVVIHCSCNSKYYKNKTFYKFVSGIVDSVNCWTLWTVIANITTDKWMNWLWCHSKQRHVNNVICILKSVCWTLFRSCFKIFFICTFNARKVTFIHFLFEWCILCSCCGKTVWMDVKFLDSSLFKN